METTIRENGAGLRSDRALERKKSAEALKSYLNSDAAPALLTGNTLRKSGYNWNNLFDDVFEYLLKECEKFETSKSFDNIKPLCSNLLHSTVAGSNKDNAYIKCDKITDASLYFLRNNRLQKAFGDTFLNLLYKHVMPHEYYLGSISPETWKELLETSIIIYLSPQSIIDDFTNLKLVLVIIQNAVGYCQFVSSLVELLPQLRKCYKTSVTDKKIQDTLVEIAATITEKLASEYRLTICEFTESIAPTITRFYDHNADKKKKEHLFKFLYLTVILHHPEGKLENNDGCIAHKWSQWRNQLKNVLEIVHLEVNCIQKAAESKFKFQNDPQNQKADWYFIELSAYVYYVVLNSNKLTDDASGPSTKRLRIELNKYKTFSDLIDALQQNPLPWLKIIYSYLSKFRQSISSTDYIKMLNVLEIYITTNNTNLNWEDYNNIIILILNNIKNVVDLQDDPIIVSLWKTSIRCSTSLNSAHKAMHSTIKTILNFGIFNSTVVSLVKFYNEKAMPVTDSSVETLNTLFNKYFGKFSEKADRISCFEWLLNGKYTSLKDDCVKELLLRIISKENINIAFNNSALEERDELYDTLFNSVDKCILFNEFQLELKTKESEITENKTVNLEVESCITHLIEEKFSQILDNSVNLLKDKEVKLIEFIKQIRIVSHYCDIILKFKIVTTEEFTASKIYISFKDALRYLFFNLCENFTSDLNVNMKLELLQNVQAILNYNYEQYLNEQIRLSISDKFFHKMERIINSDSTSEDIDIKDSRNDITEIVKCDLKFNTIYLLAAYCKKKSVHRNEVLDLILNPVLYNLTIYNILDVNIAVRCMQLLCQSDVEEIPVESIFTLLREMCKNLFRNVQATLHILELLYEILDAIFMKSSNIMKDNCVIMIKGYLSRCQKLYYPPNVAAVILKCVAKIKCLSETQKRTDIEVFKEGLLSTMNNNINSLRLYSCYLLTKNMTSMDSDLDSTLMDIFAVNISGKSNISLTDELSNRTSTVLHWLLAITSNKQNLTMDIVKYAIKIHHIKSLDDGVVKKVLNKIVYSATRKSLKDYMCNNLVEILEFWFNNKLKVSQLPITFFGFETLDDFVDRHMNVILPVEILWNQNGKYEGSEIVPMIKGKSAEVILEICFPNIIALSIPYVACHHYKLRSSNIEIEIMENAKTLFEYCTRKIDNEKFGSIVIENIKDFVLLCINKLCDDFDIKDMFDIDLIHKDNFYYNLEVFKCALRYLGEMIGTNVMVYLCENQPFDVSKILIKLWTRVIDENIQELKILALYRFIVIFQLVPLNSACDSFVANFACNNLMYAIKRSQNKNEILILGKALHLVLNHLLPQKLDLIQEVMPSIISTVIIKKEEGYGRDCSNLLNYLLVDMKGYLKDSIDLVDGSQNLENSFYSTKGIVVDNLKSYAAKLTHYSFETLFNLKEYLRNNQQNIFDLYKELDEIKGFSEDSTNSLIHQLINALIRIIKSSTDEKNITEACNCLAEIGICDLKTLVMMPPKETDKVKDLEPGQYFAVVLITHLCDVIFDHDPVVVNCAVNTISSLLNYREGKLALDSPGINKTILEPFVSKKSSSKSKFSINSQNFNCFMKMAAWESDDNESYEEWLIKLTNVLLNTLSSEQNYFPTLIEMCNSKPVFCENILPSLVGLLIFHSTKEQIQVVSTILNSVFQTFMDILSNGSGEDSNAIRITNNNINSVVSDKHKLIIQCMLDIVDFIRLQRKHYAKWTSNRIETYNYLKLDYKSVAWAANLVDRSITAVFYGELWCLTQNDGVPPSSPDDTSKLPGGNIMQKILQKAFISIGDIDAIDGCGTDHLTKEDEHRSYLMRSGLYTDSLLVHDIGLTFGRTIETNSNELHYGIVKSLYQSGMQHIALQYIKSLPNNTELDDMKYECCTQLGDWSIFVDTTDLEIKSRTANANLQSVIKAFRYACLKDCLALQNAHETDKLLIPLQKAKYILSLLCQKLNMNNCQNVYKVVAKLQLFKEIEDYYLVRSDKSSFTDLLDNWQVANLPKYHDIKYIETLLSQRSLILEHAAKSNSDLITDIVNVQLSYAELLLENGKSHNSHRYIAVAKKLQDSGQVSLVEGQLCWSKGHKDIALSLVRRLTTEECSNKTLNAAALRQYGNWMVESKYESGREIIDKYLKRSLDVLGPNGHVDTRLKVYYDIAKFADTEYKQVVSYMKSSVFTNKVNCMQNMKGVASSMRNNEPMSRDEKKALLTNEKLSTLDEAEIDSTFAEKDRFLRLATKYYLLALAQGEENNLSIFRVISLWFENPTLEFEDNQESFEELLSAVPRRKFLPVLPQLAPRLTTEANAIAQHLKTILYKCAKDHPHHTLPILFGLKNSYEDMCIMNASANTHTSLPQEEEPRVVAARELVEQIKEIDDNFTTIVKQMDLMCDAIISFAYYKQKEQSIPTSEPISKLKNLNAIPVPTITLPIKNDCTYTDIISISSFGKSFELVGGINCPKKMVCVGSDGKERTLLIKGEDDLRQDAVMQQVFTILNTLLETNTVTSKYKLLVRTYKVVPLSRRSGVLEWCEGTIPLGVYLIGSQGTPGAHRRYRPTDISCKTARSMLHSCHVKSNANKLQEFMKILNNFKPVFHYFFTEHYLDPVTWYERRQAYVKSVAASSMVGYILGLGDRHVQNILIDKKTAEVIHIDFGIAFDQGKVLPTPETVPFRLTQDIIAGFGPSGVEGNFRRCCEKTMQLLRDNQETLLTILEVLLCDPLYTWSITPGQAKRKQNITTSPRDTGTNLNVDNPTGAGGLAQRALLAVSSKLNGAESGGARGVLVPGQVARLLRHATDPVNLCRLFHGWQPYL